MIRYHNQAPTLERMRTPVPPCAPAPARLSAVVASPVLTACGRLLVEPQENRVTVDGAVFKLTRAEGDLLARLAKELGQTVRHEALYLALWGHERPLEPARSITVFINRLRRVLASSGLMIKSSKNYGYRMELASLSEVAA